MTPGRSSRLATLLLTRLAPNDPLAGDLQEEAQAGRSGAWYWRQVLTAIALIAWKGASARRWSSLNALVIAILLHWVVGFPAAELANAANRVLTPLVPTWFLDYHLYTIWGHAIFWWAYALMGWAVVVLNRDHEVPALVILLAFLTCFDFPRSALPALYNASPTELVFHLIDFSVRWAVAMTGVVAGGMRGVTAFRTT